MRSLTRTLLLPATLGALLGTVAPAGAAPAARRPPPSRKTPPAPPTRVVPSTLELHGPEAAAQLRVLAGTVDATRRAAYRTGNPAVAVVTPTGLVRARGEGSTWIEARLPDGAPARAGITVRGVRAAVPVSFHHDILPVLTKAGCNAGACHGKAEGQNGFKLSVFGFDPAADYQALAMEGRGRRLSVPDPDSSLLLQKAVAAVPHGGGRRMEVGDLRYRRLRRWIAEGAREDDPAASAAPVALRVEPARQTLALRGSLQLRVVAVDARGQLRDVTTEAEYSSNAAHVAEVDRGGWVQAAAIPGEAAVLIRYMGHVALARVSVPRPGVRFPRPPEHNFIDRLAWNKLQQLGIPPSPLAADSTFLRRAYLDVIGTLPSPAEARAFLADPHPDKRARLVDTLLARPEYADYWALRWSDLLRVDRDQVQPQGAVSMARWLRRQFAENRPYDELVRDVLLARGAIGAEGPAGFYRVLEKPEVMSRSVSQLFLGVRIECAQCHHHPSEKWSQEDFYGLAGFFTGVGRKPLPDGEEAIVAGAGQDMPHPRTGKPVPARALGAPPAPMEGVTDRREALADWMTAPDNPFLARALANRLWAHYFGRGLVEPLDDLRATNPATNEPLLEALAEHLRALRYDLRAFTRTLLTSRLYQLDSSPLPGNAGDEQHHSHATYRALPAEVLLDAIGQVTGVGEQFQGWPAGYRAIQVWDNKLPSYFFQIFGRPVRASVCECERGNEPSMAQALHLMNSPEIGEKLRHREGTARRLAESNLTPTELVEELYLAALSRFPTAAEQAAMLRVFAEAGADRRAATEDVLWALLNSREFVFNH